MAYHVEHEREERRLAHVAITRARKQLYIKMIRYVKAKFKSHKVENPSILVQDIVNHFIKIAPAEDDIFTNPKKRRVIEVIRMPTTWREDDQVRKLWFTPGTKPHPHPLWDFLEAGSAEESEEEEW